MTDHTLSFGWAILIFGVAVFVYFYWQFKIRLDVDNRWWLRLGLAVCGLICFCYGLEVLANGA